MTPIDKQAQASARAYEQAQPKFLGDLHERMKWLVQLIQEGQVYKTHPDVCTAVYDLETEVKHYPPAKPPYGRRPVKLRK